MKKSLLISGLCISVALMSQSALAEVKVRAGVGSSTYQLGGDYVAAKSTFSTSTVGMTFSSDTSANGAYIDFSYANGSGQHND